VSPAAFVALGGISGVRGVSEQPQGKPGGIAPGSVFAPEGTGSPMLRRRTVFSTVEFIIPDKLPFITQKKRISACPSCGGPALSELQIVNVEWRKRSSTGYLDQDEMRPIAVGVKTSIASVHHP
jgi:hypothetical protein